MSDLFLENDFNDYFVAVKVLSKEQPLGAELREKQSNLYWRFIHQLSGLERAILWRKLECELYSSHPEVARFRLELLRQATVGTPVQEVIKDLLRREPKEPDPSIRGPYLNMVVGAALGELAEMAHRAKLAARCYRAAFLFKKIAITML